MTESECMKMYAKKGKV